MSMVNSLVMLERNVREVLDHDKFTWSGLSTRNFELVWRYWAGGYLLAVQHYFLNEPVVCQTYHRCWAMHLKGKCLVSWQKNNIWQSQFCHDHKYFFMPRANIPYCIQPKEEGVLALILIGRCPPDPPKYNPNIESLSLERIRELLGQAQEEFSRIATG